MATGAELKAMSMSQKRILVVEDERAIREMLTFNLNRAGYTVMPAADGREADLHAELDALFNEQNASPSDEVTSIPATFLRVEVSTP